MLPAGVVAVRKPRLYSWGFAQCRPNAQELLLEPPRGIPARHGDLLCWRQAIREAVQVESARVREHALAPAAVDYDEVVLEDVGCAVYPPV